MPKSLPSVLLIHGVGKFNESVVRADATRVVKEVFGDAVSLSLFNWDRRAGRPFRWPRVDPRWIQETGLGMLNASRLGAEFHPESIGGQLFATTYYLTLAIFVTLPWVAVFSIGWSWIWGVYWSVIGLAHGSLALFLALSRIPAKTILRQHILLLLWPPLTFFTFHGLFELLVIAALVFAFLFNEWEGIALWCGGALLATYVYSLISQALSPMYKVIGDIFRWIGLPGYRRGLREAVDERFREIIEGGHSDIWIIAHSLGSVIAVDGLLRNSHQFKGRNVVLVTLGSPLKRFFSNWFPNTFPTPGESAAYLTTQIGSFSWINVYRPLDPIGTRLSLTEDSLIKESSTGQRLFWLGLVGAHVNYWGDKIVAQEILATFNRGSAGSPVGNMSMPPPPVNGLFRVAANKIISPLSWRERKRVAQLLAMSWPWLMFAVASAAAVKAWGSDTCLAAVGLVAWGMWGAAVGMIRSLTGVRLHPLVTYLETLFCLRVCRGRFGFIRDRPPDPGKALLEFRRILGRDV